jgi:large subunit ribosomal protein L21
VQPEQTIDIDRVAAEAGARLEFREVLLVGDEGDVQLGTPFVEGARVVAEVLDQGRGKKILVFKYKNKTHYRRRHGHRQAYTRLAIRQILTDGQTSMTDAEPKPARTQRRRAAPKTKGDAAAAEIATPESAEATVAVAETKAGRAKQARAAAPLAATDEGAAPEQAARTPEAEAKPARRTRTKKTAESGE